MKFLILRTEQPEFLQWLYSNCTGLKKETCQPQIRSDTSWRDPYQYYLHKLGHDAYTVFANDELMQKAWASRLGSVTSELLGFDQWKRRIHTIRLRAARTRIMHLQSLFRPVLDLLNEHVDSWFYQILEAQIRYFRPDVLLNQAMHTIRSRFLARMKPYVCLLVGQAASPLPRFEQFTCYDLVISSLPSFVEYFRSLGISSALHWWGFDPRILRKMENRERNIPVSFVGGLSWHHKSRLHMLRYLCTRLPYIQLWGEGFEELLENSPIRKCYRGKAWAIEMYQVLNDSKITLNQHGEIAGPYAANRRLLEATGVGSMLLTDWKVNLHEIFELGREVVAYRTPEECLELIQYYLEHNDERETIAKAGQQRTLRQHTYDRRAKELVALVQKYL